MDWINILALATMATILGLSLYFGYIIKAKNFDERKLRIRLSISTWVIIIATLALTNFVPKNYHLFLIVIAILIVNVIAKQIKKANF